MDEAKDDEDEDEARDDSAKAKGKRPVADSATVDRGRVAKCNRRNTEEQPADSDSEAVINTVIVYTVRSIYIYTVNGIRLTKIDFKYVGDDDGTSERPEWVEEKPWICDVKPFWNGNLVVTVAVVTDMVWDADSEVLADHCRFEITPTGDVVRQIKHYQTLMGGYLDHWLEIFCQEGFYSTRLSTGELLFVGYGYDDINGNGCGIHTRRGNKCVVDSFAKFWFNDSRGEPKRITTATIPTTMLPSTPVKIITYLPMTFHNIDNEHETVTVKSSVALEQ